MHGLHTAGFLQNPYPYLSKPIPLGTGMGFLGYGCGSPGKPQGYLCQSLIMPLPFSARPNI
jgi:hypothetical protein